MKTQAALLIATLTGAFCLTVSAYQKTTYQVGTYWAERNNPVILTDERSGKKVKSLWIGGPRLDGKWKSFSFAFTPHADNRRVFLRFGPSGGEKIPCYYRNIKINGKTVDNSSGWSFPADRKGSNLGAVTSDGVCVYHSYGCVRNIKVHKGKRIEISMEARAGSVLIPYADELASINKLLKSALAVGIDAKIPEFSKLLNNLIALSQRYLAVSIQPPKSQKLSDLHAKVTELAKVYMAKGQKETKLSLVNRPQTRKIFREELSKLSTAANKIRQKCLLKFMFGDS